MVTKKLNYGLVLTSKILNFLIILYFAVLSARFVWWVINPSLPDIYVEKTSITQFDNSVKYIINRYPFGVVTAPPILAAPPVAQQIKLTGVYLNTLTNSIAFIEFKQKPMIVKIGATISEGAILKAINANSIIIEQNGRQATISFSGGGAASPNAQIGSNGQNYSPAVTTFPPVNPEQPTNVNPMPEQVTPAPDTDEFKERRKKLIEEFIQRERSASDTTATK